MCWVTVGTVLAGQWSVWSAGTGAEELQKEAEAGIQPVEPGLQGLLLQSLSHVA